MLTVLIHLIFMMKQMVLTVQVNVLMIVNATIQENALQVANALNVWISQKVIQIFTLKRIVIPVNKQWLVIQHAKLVKGRK